MSIDMPTGQMFREETVCSMGMTASQVNGGKEWIKNHKETEVLDTPLWVLISLGILAVREAKNEMDSNI